MSPLSSEVVDRSAQVERVSALLDVLSPIFLEFCILVRRRAKKNMENKVTNKQGMQK